MNLAVLGQQSTEFHCLPGLKCHPNYDPRETVSLMSHRIEAGGIARFTVPFEGLLIVGALRQHMEISTGSNTLRHWMYTVLSVRFQ